MNSLIMIIISYLTVIYLYIDIVYMLQFKVRKVLELNIVNSIYFIFQT